MGPQPPKPKKRKVLEFEQQYLAALPLSEMYERSYMHRDTLTAVAATKGTDFLITASADGHLKFWKKQPRGVEFAKHFRAHLGPVTALAVSDDGALCASISSDKTAKVFDVATFDMIAMLRLPYTPGCAEWAFQRGEAQLRLAISDAESPAIHLYDVGAAGGTIADADAGSGAGGARAATGEPLASLPSLHAAPVTAMRYCAAHALVLSTDAKGMIEYWCPSTLAPAAPPTVAFTLKLDTDLYALAKAGAVAHCLEVSPDGEKFVAVSDDRRVRVWRLRTGRLLRVYDETLEAAQELQRTGSELNRLDPIDFGRRLAVERELVADASAPRPNAVFDASGNFLLYPTVLGVKVVNLVSNRVVRVIGRMENTERFLRVVLWQGAPRTRKLPTGADSRPVELDPTLLACAYRRQRLYLFTRHEPAEGEEGAGRDVYNERPVGADAEAGAMGIAGSGGPAGAPSDLPRGAVIHTNKGDIWVKLFPDECPRTVENFTTHGRSGYYDKTLFHRVIKGFMIQGGDPLGDGTGGESIWGGEFGDEISRNLRHDRAFTLSMANAGPGTNGSQFFITTVPTPWLDGKHTVFGRVVRGSDVVLAIEKVRTAPKSDRPLDEVRVLSIEPRASAE